MNKRKLSTIAKRTLSNLIVVCVGVLFFLALFNWQSVKGVISNLLSIVSPFVMGIALAYVLNMPMRFFERTLFSKLKHRRGFSIVLTYLIALLLVVLLIGLVLPQVFESIMTLLGNLPGYLDNLNDFVNWLGIRFQIDEATLEPFLLTYTGLVTQLSDIIRNFLPNLVNVITQIGSGVVGALTAIIASIYMLGSKEKLLRQCKRVLYAVFPQRFARATVRVGRLSNGVFSGFIGGKLLDSAIIGVICFVFMSLMNLIGIVEMPFALLISIIIGVTNIIPFFGPFIGAIPSIMILLMVNPWSAIWFTVFIIVLQQFDGNILGPKILGDSTGLPAIWVLVAIIVGGGLFGFVGMLLGVPTTAVLYTLASDFIARRLRKKNVVAADIGAGPEVPENSAGQKPPDDAKASEDTTPK